MKIFNKLLERTESINLSWDNRLMIGNSRRITLGRMPELSIISSLGLLLIAFANNNARKGIIGAELLFWCGLLVIFIPISYRLASIKIFRSERIGLLLLLGIVLYIVKIMNSPIYFSYHDELLTWRTSIDIIETGKLFQLNSLHPVGPLYPGLSILTSAIVGMSNLSIYYAGIIILGIARILLILSLYLFFEYVSQSEFVSAMATLLYMTNPNFLFFDAQFAYESLALPIAVFVLFLLTLRLKITKESIPGVTMIVLLGLGAVIIIHHITSFVLIGFICLWSLIAFVRKDKGNSNPSNIALIGLIFCLLWIIYIATITIDYLAPNIIGGLTELYKIIVGDAIGRVLFQPYSGNFPLIWERILGYVSVLLITLGIGFGFYNTLKQYRINTVALALAIGSLAYPVSQILRVTQTGFFVAVRSVEYLFIFVAFILAIAIIYFLSPKGGSWGWTVVITLLTTSIFIGGVTTGRPPWMRLPGQYLVVADTRSIEAQGINASKWVKANLGTNNRIGTDRINGVLMGTFGEQYIVTGIADQIPVGQLFFSSEIGEKESLILQNGDFQYLVTDLRLSRDLPMAGFYFQMSEPGAYQHINPISTALLTKFDNIISISRIFDSGDILIFDVEKLILE